MALEGLLQDVRLDSVVHVIAKGRKTGALTLMDGEKDGIIYIEEGVPLNAVLDDLAGDEALKVLMGWQTGRFVFEENIVSRDQTISPSLQEAFLDGVPGGGTEDVEEHETEAVPEDGLLSVLSHVLEHSTLGISAMALVRPAEEAILASSSILDKDRSSLTSLVKLLQSMRAFGSEAGRGEVDLVTLLDQGGWFVAMHVRDAVYLLCIASSRAKLGQLLFHLKRVQNMLGGLRRQP